MSKPQPASGSLEDILASIRKSLAEQSTDALTESPSPVAEVKPAQRKDGLVGRLASATGSAPQPKPDPEEDDLSDVLVTDASGASSAAPIAAETPIPKATEAPASPDKDPLWFLTRREEPGAAKAEEPALTRPEVVRASMPPFFGSSAEAAKVETTPPGAGSRPPAGAGPNDAAAMAREVSMVAAAAETAAGRPPVAPAFNGAADGRTAAGATLQAPHALEAMVLELLKPMMREWLDRNMPRLVAAALKDEAERDPLKTASKKS
jgi:cell pole-organizing protein PopZ